MFSFLINFFFLQPQSGKRFDMDNKWIALTRKDITLYKYHLSVRKECKSLINIQYQTFVGNLIFLINLILCVTYI